MSYQLQLAAVPAPELDLEVFPFLNKLRLEAANQPPSALLKRFHDKLAALFPDTPWSEGAYHGDIGRLTLVRRRKEVVPHVLFLAGELGLTVVDNQSGEVHRPPTYMVVLEGPSDGVAAADAAARLAALMRKPVADMQALLSSGRRTVVKKGVPRFRAKEYAAALRERAGCRATLAPEPGPVAHPEPPPPAPPKAAAAATATTGTATTVATATATGTGTGTGTTAASPVAPGGGSGLTLEEMAPPPPAAASAPPGMPPLTRARRDAAAETESGADHGLYLVADGLRLTALSGLLYAVAAYNLHKLQGWPRDAVAVTAALLTMIGFYRLAKGVGSNIVMRALGTLMAIIPLVNLLVFGLMLRRGKVTLRENGIDAGWLGASGADIDRLRGRSSGILPSTIFALLGGLVLLYSFTLGKQAVERQRNALLGTESQPCALVGVWSSNRLGADGALMLRDDGVYAVVASKEAEGRFKQEVGEWSVSNWSIVLTSTSDARGDFGSPYGGELTLRLGAGAKSMDFVAGNVTVNQLKRVRTMKSERCGFN